MEYNFDESLIRRYLLGELDEAEQIEVEDRVFDDADARAMLEAAENDLIDEYAANYLTNAERELFEKMFFNSASRREKIEFAVALAQVPAEKTQTVSEKFVEKRQDFWTRLFNFSFAPQFAFAALALIVTAFGAWFLFMRQSPKMEIARENGNQNISQTPAPSIPPSPIPEISPTITPKANSNIVNLPETVKTPNKNANIAAPTPLPTQPKTMPAPSFATLIFPTGLTRDNNAPKLALTIPANAQNARFVFNLEKGDEFPAYQISVASSTGANVASARLTRRNRTIVLTLPAAKLSNGFYTAILQGINSAKKLETIGYYDFAVKRP